jgi:hypothetical protein
LYIAQFSGCSASGAVPGAIYRFLGSFKLLRSDTFKGFWLLSAVTGEMHEIDLQFCLITFPESWILASGLMALRGKISTL